MSTLTPRFSLPFTRDIEFCPYSDNCRYAKVCDYAGKPTESRTVLRQIRGTAVSAANALLGTALLLGGVGLSITLFLIPLGLPLALLGVALLTTSGEAAERSE